MEASQSKTAEELEQEEEDAYFAMMEREAALAEDEDEEAGRENAVLRSREPPQGDDVDEDEYFSRVESVNIALSETGIRHEEDPVWRLLMKRVDMLDALQSAESGSEDRAARKMAAPAVNPTKIVIRGLSEREIDELDWIHGVQG